MPYFQCYIILFNILNLFRFFFFFRFFFVQSIINLDVFLSAEDFGITRIAGLPWAQWNAGLTLPLIAEMEIGTQPLVLPSNDSPSSSPQLLSHNDDSSMGNGLIIDENSDKNEANYSCDNCGRMYKLKSSLRNHQKWECGKDPQFSCPFCVYKAKQKMHINRHLERMHKEKILESSGNAQLIAITKEEKLNHTL